MKEAVVWVAAMAISYVYGFYWTVTATSFGCTRLLYLGLCCLSDRPDDSLFLSLRYLTKRCVTTIGWIIFALATIWCISLTPLQILVLMAPEVFISQIDHQPFDFSKIVHDPGEQATVEYIMAIE